MQVRPGRHPVGPSDDVDEVREKEEPPAGEEQAGQRERQSYEPVVVKVGAQAGAWPGLAALVDHACRSESSRGSSSRRTGCVENNDPS